jgi:GNAT superfamily N-acetyltransferase
MGASGRASYDGVSELPRTMKLVRYADRPDLCAIRFATLSERTFPEYMHNNQSGTRYWGRLYDDHPDFQLGLLDGDELVAELHSLPAAWDGSVEDLPPGWDDVFTRAFESGREPTALFALAISVLPERQGEQLSSVMINGMRDAARQAGLRALAAPVRPTRKADYPLIPIERYMQWRRGDGAHFDPWLRIHERVGGRIVAAAPESMTMVAPVSDWEEWTDMQFPEDGTYVFPGALAPLEVRDGVGTHVEPNVWVVHDL